MQGVGNESLLIPNNNILNKFLEVTLIYLSNQATVSTFLLNAFQSLFNIESEDLSTYEKLLSI